ncbi:FAD-dependent oxidoreductase, partial [Patescibacteria group bacterium]|nr:FAD-dependent oxidoreductase [Patescibacteria group bacterium]
MSIDNYDVIVIGGGPAAAHAAYPLVEAGIKVAMVDGGITKKEQKVESRDFESFRREDPDQHRLFLGNDLSGLNIAIKTHADSMITGNKAYVVSKTKEWLPVKTRGLDVIQSLAKGGLGECWSGVCEILDSEELTALGIPPEEMRENYKKVVKRVGISGKKLGYGFQPSTLVDVHGDSIIRLYKKKKNMFESLGLVISLPTLGVITKDKDGRRL